jgi:hypothetical protein
MIGREIMPCAKEIVAFMLALVFTVLVAGSAAAQTGDMLRSINTYGKDYRPFVPEQLRLLSPANESPPEMAKDNYVGLLAAKVVSGEYYLSMQEHFSDLPKDLAEAQGVVIARSRQLCGITGSEGETNQQRGCYKYYYDIGKEAYNLRTIKAFSYCKGNVRSMLWDTNEQYDIGNITNIAAAVHFATAATAYKWCTVNFGQNLTVVPPTPENTKFSPPDGWEPVNERTPADWETIDAATAQELLRGGANPALAAKNTSANDLKNTIASFGAIKGSGWVRVAVYAGIFLVVLIVAIVIYHGRRKPRSPQQHHASSHAGHSVHGK